MTDHAILVLRWFDERGQSVERTARYMRDELRIGGIRACRELVREALVEGYGAEYMALVGNLK